MNVDTRTTHARLTAAKVKLHSARAELKSISWPAGEETIGDLLDFISDDIVAVENLLQQNTDELKA